MTNQEQIAIFIEESLEGSDCFLVDFKVKPTNNYKVYIDADTGFTLEKCIAINRSLRRKIEEAALYPEGDFSIEVSSPGVDMPLKQARQYHKHIGRKLEIELVNEDEPGILGRLLSVNEDGILIEIIPLKRGGKKTALEPEQRTLLFTDIQKALVCIEF